MWSFNGRGPVTGIAAATEDAVEAAVRKAWGEQRGISSSLDRLEVRVLTEYQVPSQLVLRPLVELFDFVVQKEKS